jgi:hypothetical protein
MDKKKSKVASLNYFISKEKKKQYRITLPPKMVKSLGWKPKDKLKVWVNKEKKQIRIKRPPTD